MAATSDGDTILLNCLEAFKRIPPQVRALLCLLAPPSISLSSHPPLGFSVPRGILIMYWNSARSLYLSDFSVTMVSA